MPQYPQERSARKSSLNLDPWTTVTPRLNEQLGTAREVNDSQFGFSMKRNRSKR